MARKNDLSTPRGSGGGSGYDADAFARFAESVARFFGTGRYLAMQSIFVVLWIGLNAFLALEQGRKHAFDPYPFILLNLVFSTQAAYAAPLILLASNQSAARDRATLEHAAKEAEEGDVKDDELMTRLKHVEALLEQLSAARS